MKITLLGYCISIHKENNYVERIVNEVDKIVNPIMSIMPDKSWKIERIKALRLSHIMELFPKDMVELNEDGVTSLYFAKCFVELHWR